MLTPKQYDLLLFISQRLKETGIPPSFEEMKQELGLSSKSGVHRLITALVERGFIRRLPNRARAIEILRLPDAMRMVPSPWEKRDLEQVATLAEDNLTELQNKDSLLLRSNSIEVLIMGIIAAGVPITAIQQPIGTISIPIGMLRMGDHYALEFKGDSMVEAGILDGDIVIIRRERSARLEDIVIALIDNIEATLKRYRRQGDLIALEAANPAYQTKVLEENRVEIQGVLAGLIRRY
ncbi:transcriptional repressor LexA [Bartonella sp. DGB2]|uniref:transcriptional repressor LexA n=1 Tax=Bartonella sp. DGB2 TaxID=3388426 RepID=UPI00398F94E3